MDRVLLLEAHRLPQELHMRFKEDLLSPFTSLSAQQFALLIGSYLEFLIENPEKRQNLWHLVLTLVGKNSMNEGLKSASLLRKLLQMGEEGILKDLYANHELENMTNGLAKALGDNESYVLLRGLIEQHSTFRTTRSYLGQRLIACRSLPFSSSATRHSRKPLRDH